ncbi:MAG: rRNA-binding ribosome biosynthesis protein utp25 [Pycnora praestabilis]|nr:MAG: rRNA-binding ribosome biosynthesis protein utp25 [Pycnora praestabilis]
MEELGTGVAVEQEEGEEVVLQVEGPGEEAEVGEDLCLEEEESPPLIVPGLKIRYMNSDEAASDHLEAEIEEESRDGDSSEEEEASGNVGQPYNALLQSLISSKASTREIPLRKKRKISHTDTSTVEQKGGTSRGTKVEAKGEVDIDVVDEAEEGATVVPEDLAGAEDVDGDEDGTFQLCCTFLALLTATALDPFEVHFANPDDNLLSRRLKAITDNKWSLRKMSNPLVGNIELLVPDVDGPQEVLSSRWRGPEDFKLKRRLVAPTTRLMPQFNDLEGSLAPHISNCQDLLFCSRSTGNAESLRKLTCLHALNHIFKTRDRVIKDNARLSREQGSDELELRDQGFTRPKVLMLLPTRQSCVKAVETITALCEPEQQENKKRFQDSYVEAEEKFSDDKPEDFRELFGGNDDDMFRLGMKFTRKTVKYFSQFYNSDIIFASPLGLRMAIGSEDAKKQDYDFLSSIEILVIDQADAMLMQNWEYITYIFEHLNLQPKEAHGCDFSRVRNWYLDSNAKHLRQSIVLSAFNTPELNNLYSRHMNNVAGKVKFTSPHGGAIEDLPLRIVQTFSRYTSDSPSTDPDTRFKYFTTAIVPSLIRHTKSSTAEGGQGTLVFIPSYLDFVRMRNYFSTSSTTQNISFGSISEYTSVRDVARARSHFFSGRHSILLYTERAHHFRRYQIRGVKKVIMYGLPDSPIFYREIVGGYLGTSVNEGKSEIGDIGVRVVFSKWDALKLERVVGTKRFGTMLGSKGGDTFDFV